MPRLPPTDPTDLSDDDEQELSPLLSEPFARAWTAPPAAAPGSALAGRLRQRIQRSLLAEQGLVTVRARSAQWQALAPGVWQRWLYQAPHPASSRPGEPLGARVVELSAGSTVALTGSGALALLVMQGAVSVDGEQLGLRDYLHVPAGVAVRLASAPGAEVFVREADGGPAARTLVRDAEAGWPEFVPGIRRRVLWAAAGQAAMLYRADAGAQVPLHRHGHDEECLMLEGELFLDDVLLQAGDYQLAPAGTGHQVTETDTGAMLYAHGDLDLRLG